MNRSLWQKEFPSRFPWLKGAFHTDVVVIGGGMAGIFSALRLSKAGKKVLLVDKGTPLCGESAQTTAHLTEVLDSRFYELIEEFGRDKAYLIAAANRRGLQEIEKTVVDHGINCSFEKTSGYLFCEDPADRDMLREEVDAMEKLGIRARYQAQAPVPFRTSGCIEVPEQAQFHPVDYLHGLIEVLVAQGVQIIGESQVVQIVHGEPCEIFTRDGRIFAEDVVIATNDPISHPGFLQTKIASYRSYALALKVAEPSFERGLFWDTDEPYHYLRKYQLPEGPVLIVGGEDHKTGIDDQTTKRFTNLESYSIARFQVEKIIARWSGQIIETVDGLPYLGRDKHHPHFYLATGFSGNGFTWGALAGTLIAEQITRGKSEWEEPFAPDRLNPRASFEKYVLENKDFPICYVGDRVKTVGSLCELARREGAIVDVDGKRVAAYRDQQGHVQAFSPYCPHMGCYVRWNNAESTWDCPCHGSRFDTSGQVLNGPSTENLQPVVIEKPLEEVTLCMRQN